MSDLFRSVMGGSSDGLVGSIVEAGSHRLNISKKVAEGGFAVVYRAVSESSGETVAVKRLLSNDAERKKDAIREASLLRKLNHKNIVKFVTAAQMGNNNAGYEELLVVMEWCPCAVPDLLKDRGGFLSRIETTKVMYQTCAALSALHKLNPPHTHRDIKGENLLLSPQGVIKLCDFGSVTTETFFPDDSWNHMQRTKVEEDSQRATTPAYRAPEICDLYSNFPIDTRQDLWAAGCLLILLTTGRHPFEMGEKLAIINGRYAPSTRPEHAPFASVVKQLLVLDPRKRCQTIPDLMDAIRAIADNCQINAGEAINPVPVRNESPPKLSPSPSQQPFQNSMGNSSIGEQRYKKHKAGTVLNKAKGIGSGLFSKFKSGLNEAVEAASEYAENKGWDQTLRQNVGINLPRSGPKHSQAPQNPQRYSQYSDFERDPFPSNERVQGVQEPTPPPKPKPNPPQPPPTSDSSNFFETLDWSQGSTRSEQPTAPQHQQPVQQQPQQQQQTTPSVDVADLLSDSAPSQPTPPQANPSYDPFAQWSSSSQPKPAPNVAHDLFDPLAEAPASTKGDSGPDLMGDWNAQNILQNKNRANFSHMQQPKPQTTTHDPFANLTSMGNSLPKTPNMPQQQQHQRPQQQQNVQQSYGGVSSTGAWGATFQTRPQAAQNSSAGWNPNAYMQTNVSAYKMAQTRAQTPTQTSTPPAAKKGAAFDDLLSGFGTSFGSKEAERNRKMGDMKKETENKFRDPNTVKVEAWAKGRENNVRALIAALPDVLWEGNSWKPVTVGDILQPPAVKKAYRRACLIVHPDKHTGGEHEALARAIFMQMAESYTIFEQNPSM